MGKRDGPGEGTFPIVGIGASAGGLEAFTQLLGALPLDTGMGFVLVQHLDPDHESALTQILSRATLLPVHEIVNDEAIKADHVYVIPRDAGLSIHGGVLKLQPRPRTRAPHRPIDSFFESLGRDQHERAVGVVLSGTANDGTLGLEAIKAEGGITFAQDDSAKHDSMPRSAVAAGCVDLVLPPAEIARELARIARHPYVAGLPRAVPEEPEDDRADAAGHEDDRTPLHAGGKGTPPTGGALARAKAERGRGQNGRPASDSSTGWADQPGRSDSDGYQKILLLLHNHAGVDFSLYKSSTIQRRINRRLVLSKQSRLEEYVDFLRGSSKELDALYSDVLISVTSFFRNPETFDVLENTVLPRLIQGPGDDPLRCWVLGCSTGQEAYSIAMAFTESVEKTPRMRKLQIFATDLNDALLNKARHGLYAKNLAADMAPQRLRRFFVEEEGGYRVSKPLREMVVFARQNVVSDPPFSRMDLISCRNLLIYLEPSLQRKAIPTFHYALKPGGFLLLGASESISGFHDLFETMDKKNKIYSRKPTPIPRLALPPMEERGVERTARRPQPPPRQPSAGPEPTEGARELSAQREADRISVNRFAPPGVLVNAELQILQFRGPTGAFLEPPVGKASFDVLKMAREGLMLPLRGLIEQARKGNKAARREGVRVKRGSKTRAVNLEVIPLKNLREPCFLILFEEAQARPAKNPPPSARRSSRKPDREERSRLAELETELSEMRAYLQSMQEQHEATNEDVQAAHEEVQSANEELQSINEELETSKEELESTNEELTTVNEEMSNRNVELNRLNNDLVNLQTSTKLPVVLFGRDLTIRRFSPQAEKQFDLIAADLGRPVAHLHHGLVEAGQVGARTREPPLDLEALVAEVIAEVREQEREVLDRDGRWRSLRVRPYLTHDNKVDGAVLVLLDIDKIKRSEQSVTAARDYAESTFDTVREPLLVLDPSLHVLSANRAFYRVFQVTPAETTGKLIHHLGDGQWNIPRLRELLEEVASQHKSVEDFEVDHDFAGLGHRKMLLNARLIEDPQRQGQRILVAIEDVTAPRRAEKALRASEQRYRTLVEQVKDYAIFRTDPQGRATTWNEGVKRVLGFDEGDFVGHDIVETIFTPEDLQSGAPQRELDTAAETGAASNDRWMRRQDGEHFAAAGVTTALRDDAGKLLGFTKVMRDQTEKVRAEEALRQSHTELRSQTEVLDTLNVALRESEERLLFTLDATQVGQWDLDLGADAADRSLRHDQIFGYDALLPSWGYKAFLTEHVHPDDRAQLDQSFQRAVSSGEPWEFECRIIRRDGAVRWIWGKGIVYRRGGVHPRMSGLVMDITERKRLENELRQVSIDLSEAAGRRNEFLAMLGHELRNPLSALAYGLGLQGKAPEDRERSEHLRAMMLRQAKRIGTLLDQLLDIARVTSGKFELAKEGVDLAEVIRGAVETVKPVLEAQTHELTMSLPPDRSAFVLGDAVRLSQIVENLLTNAAKYTNEGGRIALSLALTEEEARIVVADNGTGMSAELLPHVFEVFTQAPRALDRGQGGLGLGLPLVQRLVEMHGGHVTASSPGLGQGSEFIVTLPRAREGSFREPVRDEQAGAPLADPDHIRPHRILVVDDEPDAAQALADLLAEDDHETLAVGTGLAALRAVPTFKPEVILLDLGLPDMDGYEVARRTREQQGGKEILLIAVTGYQNDDDRLKEAGFDHHLLKPPDTRKLSVLLATWNEGGRSHYRAD